MSRKDMVINPDWAAKQPGWSVMHQAEGDIVFADRPHSVFGTSCLNIAWNVCHPAFMDDYIDRMICTTDKIRQESPEHVKRCWGGLEGRSFVLGVGLVKAAIVALQR